MKKLLPFLRSGQSRKGFHTSAALLKALNIFGGEYTPTTHIEHVASIDVTHSMVARTKRAGIICTIGPASREIQTLLDLIDNGMNIARLNFSHGTHEYHRQTLENIRKAVEIYSDISQRPYPVGIAIDTKGPEIRTGVLEAGEKSVVELKEGSEVTVTTDEKYAKSVTDKIIYVDYKNIVKILVPGSLIYIDDGLMSLNVIRIDGNKLVCKVEDGGELGSRKGINLPGVHIDLPAVSEKDKEDINFALQNNFDMVFASFIRDKSGVEDIRKLIKKGEDHKNISIIAKIENMQGVENLDEIIAVSDGLMVARGDLGIEMPSEKVFLAQKAMIAKCNLAGKPIICATQMLDSMMTKPRPTRAETSDVANAILDGADCVMLSGETAKGKYPIECVKVMRNLCIEAEAVIPYRQLFLDLQKMVHPPTPINVSTAIAGVAAADKSSATAILVITTTGYTAFMVSRFRPPCPIIAITVSPEVARKCHLYRGVMPALHTKPKLDDWAKDVEERIRTGIYVGFQSNIIHEEDTVIFLTGWKKGRGSTNTMRIIEISRDHLLF